MLMHQQNFIHDKSMFPKLSRSDVISQGCHFWNQIDISVEEFESFVGHLDIIFFRNRGNLSDLQRFLMGSYYDHVGILFRD